MSNHDSFVILCIAVNSYDENNDLVAYNQFSTFVVGSGGFGGKRSSDKIIVSSVEKE